MVEERLYIVTYDISDTRRWRRVFKLMHGYGHWLQLSVFQCRLTGRRRAELARRLEEAIHAREDHVLILDLGLADKIEPRVESCSRHAFDFLSGESNPDCGNRFLCAQLRDRLIPLGHRLLKAADIVEQARRGKAQEIESEIRVLEIKFFQSLIADGQNNAVPHAIQRLRAVTGFAGVRNQVQRAPAVIAASG